MTTVFGWVERPGGTAAEEVSVVVDLFVTSTDPDAPGFIPADQVEIFDRTIVETGSTDNDWPPGYFELALPPTAAGDNVYDVEGNVYKVVLSRAGSQGVHYIDVPASPDPVWLGNIRVPAPPDPIPPGLIATLDDLTDVVITNPTTGQILTFDGTDWVNGPPGGTGVVVLDDIADVDLVIPLLAEGDVLAYDLTAGDWTNQLTVRSMNGLQGDVTFDAAGLGAVPLTDAGVPGGYPVLDGLGIIPDSFLPDFVATVNGETGNVTLDAVDIPLDESGFVAFLASSATPDLQELAAKVDSIPLVSTGLVDSVNGQIGNVLLDAANVNAIALTAIGAPDGIAPLDSTARVPLANMPPLVTSVDGLTGDIDLDGTMVAIDSSTYNGGVLNTSIVDVQLLANFIDNLALTNSGLVDSVNGKIGAVQINAIDIPVDTTFFGGNLSAGTTTLQAVADAVDDLSLTAPVTSVNGHTGVVTVTASDTGALSADLYAAANGVAPLDADALLPYINLPPVVLSINTLTGAIDLSAEMVALDNTDFVGNLDASVTDVQLLAAAVDALATVPVSGPVTSVNGLEGAVVLTPPDIGAIALTAVGAIGGVAPLDGVAMVPTTNLPDVVFSVNSLGGVVDLQAISIPVDDSGFSGNLVGVTDVQGVADVLDTFAGGGGGGGHVLKEAGSSLTQRANMNFLAGFDLADNSGTTATDVSLDLTEYTGGALALTSGGTGAITAPLARTNLGVYSTTEVDTLVNTTAANVGKRVSVRAATTANVTIATALNNGDTLDGVTLATADLVLVKNQTAPAENGIYTVGVSPARATDFDTYADYSSSLASVVSGTAGALTVWLCTSNTGGTLGTTAITYSQIATGATGTMAVQNASAVAITGGTLAGISSLALTDGVVSGATISGGKIDNATAIKVDNSYTLTQDPTDLAIGSPFHSNITQTLNYSGTAGTGPISQTVFFGPRGQHNTEGLSTYNFSTGTFGLTPLAFLSALGTKNAAATAITMTPAWTYVAANIHIADGATVGWSAPDAANGPSAFYDSTVFITENSGTWNGPARTVHSYISNPQFLGNTNIGKRIGYEYFEINEYPGGDFGPILDFLGLYGMAGNVDTTNPTVAEQIGFHVPRITGATRNIAARFDAPIELWADTYTHTTDPLNPIMVGGNHTLNYATPGFPVLAFTSTFTFVNASSALGGIAFLNGSPLYKNATTKSGSVWPLGHFLYLAPTHRADTTAVTAGNLVTIRSAPTFDRVNSGTLTVTNVDHFNITPVINTGVTVTTQRGIYIANKTGAGTVTNNYGLFIETLTGTSVAGIVNANDMVNLGAIIGGITAGSHLTLRTNATGTPGTIRLDNPTTEFVVTDYTATAGYSVALVDATLTMNAASGNGVGGYNWSPLVRFDLVGNGVVSAAFIDAGTYENIATEANNLGSVVSCFAVPTLRSQTATISGDYIGFYNAPSVSKLGASGSMTLNTAYGFVSSLTVGTTTSTTNRTALQVNDATGGGTVTTNIGVDVAPLTKGSTNISFRSSGTAAYMAQAGKATFGASTAPTWAIDIKGTGGDTGSIGIAEVTTTPTNPPSSAGVVMYHKANKIVFAFNDAGTMRYASLDLTGTGVTWVHSTVAP